jgi:hypothetical protein
VFLVGAEVRGVEVMGAGEDGAGLEEHNVGYFRFLGR